MSDEREIQARKVGSYTIRCNELLWNTATSNEFETLSVPTCPTPGSVPATEFGMHARERCKNWRKIKGYHKQPLALMISIVLSNYVYPAAASVRVRQLVSRLWHERSQDYITSLRNFMLIQSFGDKS